MKFSTLFSVLAIAAVPALGAKVTFDNHFDDPNTSLNSVACSDGKNGLVTKGFSTFGTLPIFPFIGGVPAVAGWNSPNCGTCWQLSHNGKSINILAVDTSFTYNIGSFAFNVLTGGQGQELGVLDGVVATQLPNSACGL